MDASRIGHSKVVGVQMCACACTYIYILCGEPLQEYDIGEYLCLLWCRGLSVGAAAGGRRVPAQ